MPQPDATIEVRDFGPLTHAAIDLRPLTVFVGPSNAGKTYFATLISALHRACDGFPRIPPRGLFITERIPAVPRATDAARENLLTAGRPITCSDLPDDVRARFRDPSRSAVDPAWNPLCRTLLKSSSTWRWRTMNADPILAELWAVRDRLAARFDYDLDAIFRHIKAEEAKSSLRYVECPPRRLTAAEDDFGGRGARDD